MAKVRSYFSLTALLVVLVVVLGVIPQASAQTSVFINEIHYDNASTDTGEAIEVAGPAGTDLAGWSIVLYNGANGLVYDTDALSGVIPNQQDGFGTVVVTYPTNGVQNGAPDGLALVNASNTVTQFISYEGTLTAVDGPAAGMTSTDIGVSQSGSGAVGNSLQLAGSGTVYEDFAWQAEATNTFGAVNTGQTFGDGDPGTPDLVVNEIDYDQPDADAAEYAEIKNNGSSAANLDAVTLELVNGTGGGAAIYQTFDLPDVSLAAGDYYVICANASTVANCDLDVTPDTNLIQNGSPDGVGLRFDGELLDAVSYEGDTGAPYTEGSGVGLEDAATANMSVSRCSDGADTDQNNVDFVHVASTPGEANACDGGGGEIGMCGDPATFIHEVQGSGTASPLNGSTVEVEGVVVGDFQNNGQADNGEFNGFFVQEEDADADADAATSEGIFVFAPGSTLDVQNGDVVRVLGTVSEFFNRTEIGLSEIASCEGTSTVTPASVSLPVASIGELEAFEGMSVVFPQQLVISEYFNFDRFGEIVLALPADGSDPAEPNRPFTPTAVVEPGSPEFVALQDLNLRSRITLDDGLSSQNPSFTRHPNGQAFTLDNRFRGGDIVQNAAGVLDFAFSLYRVQPTEGADYIPANPRPAAPDPVGGNMTVASFNVLNYFTTLTSEGNICGPSGNMECRGADTPEEFERQRAKIIAAIAAMDADVAGLIEIQNDEGESTEDLVNGLNDLVGAGTYAYIDTGFIGTDAIKQAFIYQPAEVTPVGSHAILDSSFDPDYRDTLNRPALAQTFRDNETNGVVTVVVNHLKSKGSDCNDVGDPDAGDGQGNCNVTRTMAAQVLADWLATDPTGSADSDFLIIGDLNAYDKEDPIDVLLANGYTDLVAQYNGEFAYSFVFDGQSGYLDHALANTSLLAHVTGTTVWHINADEADLIDYDMSFKSDAQDEIYAPDAYRSSDHDPVIVGLQLTEDNPLPVCSGATPSIASLWPPNHRFVGIDILGVTDSDGDEITITIDGILQDEAVDAKDSGNTAPDGKGVGTSTAQVRAERVESGNGRVYHISFTATDGNGGSCSGEVLVHVPVNRNGTAVDDDPLYDSTVMP